MVNQPVRPLTWRTLRFTLKINVGFLLSRIDEISHQFLTQTGRNDNPGLSAFFTSFKKFVKSGASCVLLGNTFRIHFSYNGKGGKKKIVLKRIVGKETEIIIFIRNIDRGY